jgi:hypothetical protein
MASILLVNPAPYYGGRTMAKRRMPTALRKYWAKHRRNPSRRHHRTRHHYRRNPIQNVAKDALPVIKEGAIGALGGIANAYLYSNVSGMLPTSISGNSAAEAAVKVLSAIAIGMVGGMAMKNSSIPKEIAVGAATCAIYDYAYASLNASGVSLSGVGAYMSIAPSVGARTLNGFGRVGRVGNTAQGQSIVRQLTRTTQGMGRAGGIGAYLSRTGVKVPQRGMGAYMSGVGDTTYANGIPAS